MAGSALKPPFDETVFPRLNSSTTGSATEGSSRPHPTENSTASSRAAQATSPVQMRSTHLLLPASYRIGNGKDRPQIIAASNDKVDDDLNVAKLNRIHGWLWLAGRPMPPRPLNYQVACYREITISEDINLHLVWDIPRRMFLKPIPRYLLDHQFWKDDIITNKRLYQLALGFLLSYTALIQYESDFYIAKEKHLVPDSLTWESWIKLVKQLLECKRGDLNERYGFGELRLSRLNKIYWAHCHLRGYRFPYQSYGEMFTANLAPIAGIVVYIGLVLTAMQVGLATHELGNNDAFQNASYGFTVFSILAPVILLLLVAVLLLVFFLYNWIATIIFRRNSLGKRHADHS